MKKLWIDCDPGHDDALAILVALANPDALDVIGISTIGGNESLEKVTNNAKNILHLLNADIPLVPGAAGPLVRTLHSAPEAHGDSGMDGVEFAENDYPILKTNLYSYMYEQIMQSDTPVSIVGIGPLTNIAILLKAYPEAKQNIEGIYIMGGGITHGNVTPAAEFNIYVDPEAAKIVFNSGVSITMAGLDVTEKSYITRTQIDSIKDNGRISNKIYGLLDFYNNSGKQFGFVDSPLHDLCTIIYLLDSSAFSGKHYSVDVITDSGSTRGMTLADFRKKPEPKNDIYVLLESDREKYVKFLLTGLKYFDNK